MTPIPYGRQDISQDDIDSVVSVLRSDYLTQGPVVPSFEKVVKYYCGAQYAVAVNSATSALHIACLALGVGRNDFVWTSPNTFVASANCAIYCDAKIDFVDIDPASYNLSIEKLTVKLAEAEKIGKLPKVVIPVHFSGQSCDMQALHALGVKYGFKIIEDASHAIGGKYQGSSIGGCRFSDITVFSFHPVKIVTTGEGGMALTNDELLAKKMRNLRSHGATNLASDMHPRPPCEIWNYQQVELGFNYRMTDIQAALGISQMQRLDQFVAKRQNLAARYNQLLTDLPLTTPKQNPEAYSSYHLYVVRLKLSELNISQAEVYRKLHAKGILVNLHYIPVYLHPFYEELGFSRGYCPEAEKYYSEAITIPLYSELTDQQQDYIVGILRNVVCK
jgi:UDP-4-amino-4,6-dideoxy-N-acetyl-beta-L-altrosamine transaminase